MDQSLQSLYLLNDVVVQLQFPQTRELPQVLCVQDVCRRQVLGCRSNQPRPPSTLKVEAEAPDDAEIDAFVQCQSPGLSLGPLLEHGLLEQGLADDARLLCVVEMSHGCVGGLGNGGMGTGPVRWAGQETVMKMRSGARIYEFCLPSARSLQPFLPAVECAGRAVLVGSLSGRKWRTEPWTWSRGAP